MLRILLLSDIHFIHCEDDENIYRSLETAFVEAMDDVRDSGGVNQILICGDIANKGQENEYQTAEAFLKRVFERLGCDEKQTQVYVVPGNHDINYPYAGRYIEDRYEPVPNVSPKEFRDIYNPFMIPDQAGKNHMSYAIKLRDWLWLAMCDASIYDPLPASGGLYTGENATWLQAVLDEAKAAGAQVITVTHQSLIPHTAFMLSAMTIENGSLMAEQMRSSGNARLNLSGHLHIQHISEADGLYDIATGAFSVPPFRYGMLTVRENGAAEYEARALCEAHMPQDMARLAKNWFEATVKAKERALLEALGLPEENRERMLEYAAKLNHAYFSGDFVSTDPVWTEDPAFRLWTEIREKDSMARYLTELPGSFENARSALRLALPVMNGGR